MRASFEEGTRGTYGTKCISPNMKGAKEEQLSVLGTRAGLGGERGKKDPKEGNGGRKRKRLLGGKVVANHTKRKGVSIHKWREKGNLTSKKIHNKQQNRDLGRGGKKRGEGNKTTIEEKKTAAKKHERSAQHKTRRWEPEPGGCNQSP